MLTPAQKTALEAMIDADDLSSVLDAVAEICYGKAEHLRSNWQDEIGGKIWERAGRYIQQNVVCAAKITDTIPR